VALAAALAACSTSPTSPTGTVTVSTAGPITPANGAVFANTAQPIKLTISNGLVTNTAVPVTYTFEIATDPAFSVKILSKDVGQTASQTSVTLDVLTGGKDYYWHVKTTGGDTASAFTTALKFSVQLPIVINAPVLVTPASNATIGNLRPTFTITNAVRTGPAGTITYKFDVSTTSGFTAIVATGTVAEGTTQTSFTPSSDLVIGTTYFWRAQAIDATNSITTGFSTASFSTPAANTALWPGIFPPGTPGQARLGDNWNEQTLISFGGTAFASPPLDAKQVFDLMDRGFTPQGAIDWMHDNGYSTNAAYFSSVKVIGFQYIYIALINGKWDLILRGE
jgi:hypothetical protein